MKAIHKITTWDEFELNDTKFRDRLYYFYCPNCRACYARKVNNCKICGQPLEFSNEPVGVEAEEYDEELGKWVPNKFATDLEEISE